MLRTGRVLPYRPLAQQCIRLQSTFAKGNLKQFALDTYKSRANTGEAAAELPAWQRMVGEKVISFFNVDMDRTRAGPVATGKFRDLCKFQGYYPEDNLKSDTFSTPHEEFYYKTLGLPRTFQQQFQISSLHIWMLFVRLRALPRKYCREYQTKLLNAIFEDLGHRMRNDLKVTSESIINTNKKHLNEQLRGAIFSYDEGFYNSDATLAAALWRNLFNGEENVDMAHLEQMVHYVRTQLYLFEKVSDRDFSAGIMTFIEPWKRYDALTKQDEEEIKRVAQESRKQFQEQEQSPSQRSVLSDEGW